MKKSAAVTGIALAVISLGVGLAGCGKESKTSTTTTTTTTTTSTSTSTPTTTSAQASGQNETIADYIKQNNIQETMISHDTPGAPVIDLPVPEGWSTIPEGQDAPYGGIKFNTPTDPNDPPMIIAILEKLSGNVDPDKLLSYAPGELRNLPGFEGGDGKESTLSNFPAYQLGGSHTKNGALRAVAQKTVVIQASDGIYVLQLNAEGPDADSDPLGEATNVIDEQTKITTT